MMHEVEHIGFDVYFSKLPDPRISRKKLYPLIEILFNEITAIPLLLKLLSLKDNIITIDAMGTQKVIAKQIHDEGGFYVLALKGNQGTLNDDVRLFLQSEFKKNSSSLIEDTCTELDKGHGRIEMRTCIASSQIDWLSQKSDCYKYA